MNSENYDLINILFHYQMSKVLEMLSQNIIWMIKIRIWMSLFKQSLIGVKKIKIGKMTNSVVKLCFVIFACNRTVSKNLFQVLNDLFFTREK